VASLLHLSQRVNTDDFKGGKAEVKETIKHLDCSFSSREKSDQ
jgi:hypothetical protein